MVVERSVIIMEVYLEVDSVRDDEEITLKNLQIKIINVIRKILFRLNVQNTLSGAFIFINNSSSSYL